MAIAFGGGGARRAAARPAVAGGAGTAPAPAAASASSPGAWWRAWWGSGSRPWLPAVEGADEAERKLGMREPGGRPGRLPPAVPLLLQLAWPSVTGSSTLPCCCRECWWRSWRREVAGVRRAQLPADSSWRTAELITTRSGGEHLQDRGRPGWEGRFVGWGELAAGSAKVAAGSRQLAWRTGGDAGRCTVACTTCGKLAGSLAGKPACKPACKLAGRGQPART